MVLYPSPAARTRFAILMVTALTALSACGDNADTSPTEALRGDGASCERDVECESEFCHPSEGLCAQPSCGDGVVNTAAGEACDDGGESEACNADCTAAQCGDGVVNTAAGEACDDGNTIDTDACTNACELATCGDGVVQAGEACDDGNDIDDDACTNACTLPTCGDGILQDGEACDDGNPLDTDACTNACELATCGDGFVQPGEGCDDGNTIDDDACANACALPTCGDGIVQAGEACDDGNAVDTDACLATCVVATCGDGAVQDGVEACDDAGESETCNADCTVAECGDGQVNTAAGEACDDANAIDDDACTNACQLPSCDDGVLNQDELYTDCGGATCESCNDGDACFSHSDCDSGHCAYAQFCAPHPVSCLDLLLSGTTTSGVYGIDPDQDGILEDVYCDMDTDGGGWTLVSSNRRLTPYDHASPYYGSLATIDPPDAHPGVWSGLRSVVNLTGDMRFTCKVDAATQGPSFDVDLSFYDVSWYQTITAGLADGNTCFETLAESDHTGPWNRRNNLTGEFKPDTDAYDSGRMVGEDSCGDAGDFTVDFDDRGVGGNPTDGTDWGKADGETKCASVQDVDEGVWHIWSRETTCFDGRQNGDEIDLDCGGSCAPCQAGSSCNVDEDCASAICDTGMCIAPHCTNGVQDGDETDLDCGGSCAPCTSGEQCASDADCGGATCSPANICEAPTSCLDLLLDTPGLPDGEYIIDRDGSGPLPLTRVYCDMTSDGGGYTMLKLKADTNLYISQLGPLCASHNMQLHIPRSPDHLAATLALARNPDVGPDANDRYVRFFGIYSDYNPANCAYQPFNSSNPDCDWHASDNGPFWISERTDIGAPTDVGTPFLNHYLLYEWFPNGDLRTYSNTFYSASSDRFICQVGDKRP
ncbi:DUF4215 domain-containing protein [Lujinxingia sediminis]|uniref:DUF4215 domain-containing protein n=1 Tax=Lujinxingia sediminis TaxID=2480984 RepID=A0ABY0CN03_9DELT|nr:fibrinogen-like YCDxxxxGGGW domain-containing protein [Lujinxingia sediminis]RVU40707.1 DUF4215 domain-containing protein [Lujinxingia sediminis]